jgi:DNA-binding response OmpR family regulator
MSSTSDYRALVVDDDPIVRQASASALHRIGFVCDVAANGREAFNLASRTAYDVVVTDLRMPNGNGHQLALDLRTLNDPPAIVVLTGVEEPKLVADLTARGIDLVSFKPVEYREFAKDVKRIVELRSNDRKGFALPTVNDEFDDRLHSGNDETESLLNSRSVKDAALPSSRIDQLSESNTNVPHSAKNLAMRLSTKSEEQTAKKVDTATVYDWRSTNDFIKKVDSHLISSRQALNELERRIARLQLHSYVHLFITLALGTVLGMIVSLACSAFVAR